jgi:hypothetical protein
MGGKAAVLVLREKTTDEHGNLREMVIWRVPRTRQRPDGVRYRLALIRAGEQEPAILYDNHHPKGHHRHIGGTEAPYRFVDVGQLVADFRAEVNRMLGAEK